MNNLLEILRNPQGWNDHVVRDARVKAADEIERLTAENATLKAELAEARDHIAFEGALENDANYRPAQSEPVGEVEARHFTEQTRYGFVEHSVVANKTDKALAVGTKLYAAPQPAAVPTPSQPSKDTKRLDWIAKKFFVCSWNGVVGEGSQQYWRIAGDHRHTTSLMTESSFLDAIDTAMAALAKAKGGA